MHTNRASISASSFINCTIHVYAMNRSTSFILKILKYTSNWMLRFCKKILKYFQYFIHSKDWLLVEETSTGQYQNNYVELVLKIS